MRRGGWCQPDWLGRFEASRPLLFQPSDWHQPLDLRKRGWAPAVPDLVSGEGAQPFFHFRDGGQTPRHGREVAKLETCGKCGREFKSRSGLRGHEQLVHGGERGSSTPTERVPPASVASEDDQSATSGLTQGDLVAFRDTFRIITKAVSQLCGHVEHLVKISSDLTRRVDEIEAVSPQLSRTASAQKGKSHPYSFCLEKTCEPCTNHRRTLATACYTQGEDASLWKGEPETVERYNANLNEWIAAGKPSPPATMDEV